MMKIINYECKGLWHNRRFTRQRSVWYAVFDDGSKEEAFVEDTVFPHNIFKDTIIEYWLDSFAETKKDMKKLIKEMNLNPETYKIESNFYGPGFFLKCNDLDDAIHWFETRKRIKEEEQK